MIETGHTNLDTAPPAGVDSADAVEPSLDGVGATFHDLETDDTASDDLEEMGGPEPASATLDDVCGWLAAISGDLAAIRATLDAAGAGAAQVVEQMVDQFGPLAEQLASGGMLGLMRGNRRH